MLLTAGCPRCQATATEVITIARILGTPDPLLGAAATETAVASHAHDRPIIHLATHGVMYERAPNRSFPSRWPTTTS